MEQILCEECKKIESASKHTPPHKHLVKTNFKAISSILGAADETYYICQICGHEWLHETGTAGFGWIK